MERELRRLPTDRAMSEIARRLARELGVHEETGIAAITASELLRGVHRATAEHRPRRAAFVESVLEAFPPIAFDLACARAHALLWASLVSAGADIGPHDRLVASTAIASGWRVATNKVRHFTQVMGLEVVEPNLAA